MKRLITFAALVFGISLVTSVASAQTAPLGGSFNFPDTVSLGDTVQINAQINLPGELGTDPIFITILLVQGEDTTTLCEGSVQATENNELIYSLVCIIPEDIDLGNHSIVFIITGAFGEFVIPGGGAMQVQGDHDINGDGSLNIADGTDLISYIFSGGEPPQPSLANADFDCDGSVNIGDVTKIIERIFQGAALPCHSG